ncbi:MAG: CHAT domain-containing protein [Planctomycetes bacterium]|nr:CHAT domain-containing protein [Planctomycetota bacterium]
MAGYDDKAFADFARLAFYYAGNGSLEELDVPAKMRELRATAVGRKLSSDVLSDLDWREAYYVSELQRDRPRAVHLLDEALARDSNPSAARVELALLAENIEREQEHWDAAHRYLKQAEGALGDEADDNPAAGHFHSESARFWLDMGLTEPARPHVEFGLDRAKRTGDATLWRQARVSELKLLTIERDYAALDERFDELFCEEWYTKATPVQQGECLLQIAAGWITAEHDGHSQPGRAERLLDELLQAGRVEAPLWPWVLRHRAVLAAESGDGARAQALTDQLACRLGLTGAPPDSLPGGRLGAAWITLQARLARERERGAPDARERLQPHLERLRDFWSGFLAHWSGAPLRLGGLAYLDIAERNQQLQELIELELTLNGVEQGSLLAIDEVLEAEQQSTLTRRLQAPRASLDEARRELCGEHAGVLIYLPLRSCSFAFALDPRGMRMFRLPPTREIRAPSRALAAAAQSAVREGRGLEDPELTSAAAECARVLLPPELEEFISGWRVLRIVGLDDFGYVPFEVFPSKEGGTQGARRAIIYAPSVPVALYLRRRSLLPIAGRSRLLLTLDTSASRELADFLPGDPEVIVGRAVDATALAMKPAEPTSLLYVLAHGTHDGARERPGGLLFGGSGEPERTVWAEDIEARRTPPVVVLNSCEAGRAPLRRGDGGRSDLAAAFLYSGSSAVVLPSCDLQFNATMRAMRRCFEGLAEGNSVAESMHLARAKLVAQDDGVAALQAHLLHVIGDGEAALVRGKPAASASTRSILPWVLMLAGIAPALWLVRSRKRSGR